MMPSKPALASLILFLGFGFRMWAQVPAALHPDLKTPFHFVAYGDTRFHDPRDTDAANPEVRVRLVKAIADTHPAFVCFTGDIVYNGNDAGDWNVWDQESKPFRQNNIVVYPALGNHDLHGNENDALRNYFQRFPDLKGSRYYSVRTANILLLVLDSSLDETRGAQGSWLTTQLNSVTADVDFIFVSFHHPPYTSSSDRKMLGGGHSARAPEQQLAQMLEGFQTKLKQRIVVFSGHVHNYERHEHNGVTYFVTGGGGAHAYPIERAANDPFQNNEINYHYLTVEVDRGRAKITMNRLILQNGKEFWTQPDSVTITTSSAIR